MTVEFKDMLYLLSCEIKGRTAEKRTYSDLNKILELAAQQGVWDLVAYSIIKNFGQDTEKNSAMKNIRTRLQMNIAKSAVLTSFLYDKVGVLEKNGVECCTLKGLSNALLYKNPDCRRSGDVDILIDVKDEAKALEILKDEGFSFETRHETYNETVCVHKDGGVIELHVSLYDDIREKVMFAEKGSLQEPFRKIDIPQYFAITTLGYNDGLMFNFLHCIKHFMSSGVGIRQIADVLLYLVHYREYLDFKKIEKTLTELKYKRVLDVCIYIGIKYLGFCADEFSEIYMDGDFDEVAEELLNDIEDGGVFGRLKKERHNFFGRYMKLIGTAQTQKDVINNSYAESSFLRVVFPPVKALYINYPHCKKYKIFIPIAWVQRMFNFLGRRKKRKNVYAERIKLLEDLKII